MIVQANQLEIFKDSISWNKYTNHACILIGLLSFALKEIRDYIQNELLTIMMSFSLHFLSVGSSQ